MYKTPEEKRLEHVTVGAAIAAGAAAIAGIAAIEQHKDVPNHPATPIEKQGDHHGLTPVSQPGNGTLHTEKGSFQVHGIGTAVTAESHDGGPIIEHTIKP
jgi:hypothetical protein